MDIFETHADITRDYRDYIHSFINIKDQRIRKAVHGELESGKLWPDPLIQFNPSFRIAGPVDKVAANLSLHPGLLSTFRGFHLYQHQVEAISHGIHGRDFVVTSGTGSGKSLTYMATIFHDLLTRAATQGIQAIIVYPMNALINSQSEALKGFAENYQRNEGNPFPVRYGQYTGQEKQPARDEVKANPPHILLTNYMMLELILTRLGEQAVRNAIFDQLRFLVFDELHTYRGRQGADVALLIRRILSQCAHPVTCIGTSATMVSGGSIADQKARIAGVASTFFGKTVLPAQVVTESLAKSLENQPAPTPDAMRKAISDEVPKTVDLNALREEPVLAWLEKSIALQEMHGELVRHQPCTLPEIAQKLADAAGSDVPSALNHLRVLLHRLSNANHDATKAGKRDDVILPFKLHQFFAQTGSVYVTLDPLDRRTITLDPNERHITENEITKPLYPAVFSRTSGHEFICITMQPDGKLVPREFRDLETDDDDAPPGEAAIDGYLLVGPDVWSQDDCESMPDAWVRQNREGHFEPKPEKRNRFPRPIWFSETGHWSEKAKPGWQSGWFMSAPLLFDPTSGTDFAAQTREANKLTSLGMEGRSTSTTITCFSILDRLAQHRCDPEYQKLLSFTDNRQDAALQAGHFNDFIKVVQIRSAIHRAVIEAPARMLTIHTIGEAIYNTLQVPFSEFANAKTENPMHAVRALHEETFRHFLIQRALYDLRRSWRIVLPNLEQCALLAIDYQNLDELASLPWVEVPEMALLDIEKRRDLLYGILDAFRLGFAISSRNHLDESVLRERESAMRERLKAPWTLERDENLERPYAFCLGSPAQKIRPFVKLIGSRSLLGKYIIDFFKKNIGLKLDQASYATLMERLFEILESNMFLESRTLATGRGSPSRLYWLKIDTVIWKAGDEKTALRDRLKYRSYRGEIEIQPNPFFQRLYKYDFRTRKTLRGDEHTGQLGTDLRIQREEMFRTGTISALFCSPTMELGIDIKLLSIVHMRNVPPNPANYAQRAGRAGRNGQAALVFNFCSSYSPHDRHYFRQQRSLVAGTVNAPQLDLSNEELLRTHLHAMVLAEVGLATLSDERTSSLASLIDADQDPDLPLKKEIIERLTLSSALRAKIRARFSKVVDSFRPLLDQQAGHWFNDTWMDVTLNDLPNSLDRAMERWRELYRSARRLLAEASAQLASGQLLPKSDAYRKAEREQRLANLQMSQLRNDQQGGSSNQLSEFYPYRYLASEAWLPGYNFTRLPLRVFVETQEGGGEFLSRPRVIALREFGPLNTIYHCGRKYQVNQLTSQIIDASLYNGAISRKAGYFLPPDQHHIEICPFSCAALSEAGNKDLVTDLLEMGESRAIPKHRITCEEEERLSRGYDLRTYFTVDEGHMDRIRRAVIKSAGEPLLTIRYIPAARLREINFGWRTKLQGEGFPIVTTTGMWKHAIPKSEPDEKEPPPPMRKVKLTTSDTADALYIEPMKALALTGHGVLTLQYALLRGISQVFQVESSEIGSESLGQSDTPNILLYEAAEGSLGILSQFVNDPKAFLDVVAAAQSIMRYDDPTYKGPASYDDLLSYYNQRDHQKLDRFLIQDALSRLLSCQIELPGSRQSEDYEAQYKRLCATLDPASALERTFVDYLYERSLRLPDAAQKHVPDLYCQPDFYYESNCWVFIDGSPHDKPEVRERDTEMRQRMRALGHDVLEYHYRDDLPTFVASRPDVFRKVRS